MPLMQIKLTGDKQLFYFLINKNIENEDQDNYNTLIYLKNKVINRQVFISWCVEDSIPLGSPENVDRLKETLGNRHTVDDVTLFIFDIIKAKPMQQVVDPSCTASALGLQDVIIYLSVDPCAIIGKSKLSFSCPEWGGEKLIKPLSSAYFQFENTGIALLVQGRSRRIVCKKKPQWRDHSKTKSNSLMTQPCTSNTIHEHNSQVKVPSINPSVSIDRNSIIEMDPSISHPQNHCYNWKKSIALFNKPLREPIKHRWSLHITCTTNNSITTHEDPWISKGRNASVLYPIEHTEFYIHESNLNEIQYMSSGKNIPYCDTLQDSTHTQSTVDDVALNRSPSNSLSESSVNSTDNVKGVSYPIPEIAVGLAPESIQLDSDAQYLNCYNAYMLHIPSGIMTVPYSISYTSDKNDLNDRNDVKFKWCKDSTEPSKNEPCEDQLINLHMRERENENQTPKKQDSNEGSTACSKSAIPGIRDSEVNQLEKINRNKKYKLFASKVHFTPSHDFILDFTFDANTGVFNINQNGHEIITATLPLPTTLLFYPCVELCSSLARVEIL